MNVLFARGRPPVCCYLPITAASTDERHVSRLPQAGAGPERSIRSRADISRRIVGFKQRPDGSPSGIWTYPLEDGQYARLTDHGSESVRLADRRRLLFWQAGKLYHLDSQTKKAQELLSVPLHSIGRSALAPDNRTIYLTLSSTEADIWLATLR